MTQPDVQIVVNKELSDDEFRERAEEYMQFKLDGILLCQNCDNIFTRNRGYICPRCDQDDVWDLWDVNEVTGYGVRTRL